MLFNIKSNEGTKQQDYKELLDVIQASNALWEREAKDRNINASKPFTTPNNIDTKWVQDFFKYKKELKDKTFHNRVIKEEPLVNIKELYNIPFYDVNEIIEDGSYNYTKGRLLNKRFTFYEQTITMADFIYQNLDNLDNKIKGRSLLGYWCVNDVILPPVGSELQYYWNFILGKGVARSTLNTVWSFFGHIGIRDYTMKMSGLATIVDVILWAKGKNYTKYDRIILCYIEYLSSISYDLPKIPSPNESKEVFGGFVTYLENKYNAKRKEVKEKKVKEVKYEDLFN